MRRLVVLAALVILSLAMGACSSSDADEAGTGTVASGGSSSSEATSASTATAATTGEGSGSGGTGTAPTFADGTWTGGEAEAQISGDVTGTITGTLFAESSATEPGTTRLTYTAGVDTILFSISTEFEPFDMRASTNNDLRVERPFGSAPCEVTYEEATDSRIAGTFRCDGVSVSSIAQGINGTGVVEGSFEATR
ncbi:MAG: hypothetical protein R3C39_01950 [Dehalococcoidia bacterium]